jgi:hypothetical protein
VHSDPSLFTEPQRLGAETRRPGAASVVWRAIPPTGDRVSLGLPVAPGDGTCRVDFTVTPTANPSEVIRGSTDDRELGLHFDAFAWEPAG